MQWINRKTLLLALGGLFWAAGCGSSHKPAAQSPVLASRYAELPARKVPDFLKDTILERCELYNAEPFNVSGFGLVTNLRKTGDTTSATTVREYIRKMAVTHGFGSRQLGFDNMQPEDILRDSRFAIVRVDAFIPPGARKHQRFDVYVNSLDGNNTSSLAHGQLYTTDLKVKGANPQAPGQAIEIPASGGGEMFVNPAYALTADTTSADVRASLRKATILNGGMALMDRPLVLRLRRPQLSMSRAIENRIDQAFQDMNVSAARDEALVALYVPEWYGGDWEHFRDVVMHMYLSPSPEYAMLKARQLCEEAIKPEAPLLDISYCWEAMGPTILQTIEPLMSNSNPDVAFAAARAGAYLHDSTAQTVLMDMAKSANHPFQLAAVQTLGKLPSSPLINQMLRTLLDVDQTLVRIEAYRALVAHEDPYITSRNIGQKFRLDMVPSSGPPIVYASRTGMPCIAIFGSRTGLNMPIVFTAIESRFSINSIADRNLVNVFYRGAELPEPVTFVCPPDLGILIARLGGETAPGDKQLDFNYCDIIALLQQLTDKKQLASQAPAGKTPVAFVLQESPYVEQQAVESPMIPDTPVPEPEKLGSAIDSRTNVGVPR